MTLIRVIRVLFAYSCRYWNKMNNHKRVRKFSSMTALMKNEPETDWLSLFESIWNFKISTAISLAVVLFFAVSTASVTLVAHSELSTGDYQPVLGRRLNARQEVLGETMVNFLPIVLTSASNNSLRVTAILLRYDTLSEMWVYKLKWERVLNVSGSLYLRPQSDRNNKLVQIDTAQQTGEVTFNAIPHARYQVEFFSKPDGSKGRGLVLLRKFFLTLDFPLPASVPTALPAATFLPSPAPIIAPASSLSAS